MTAAACDRHPKGEILQPSEIITAFGPTAGKLVPTYPGYGRLRNETQEPVHLSRLECGHFLMLSPTVVAAAEEKANEEAYKPTPLERARLAHRILLDKAHDGEVVAPADVAAALAAIQVEEQAEAGRRKRAEAARVKAERERLEALQGPLRTELRESAANVQAARDAAFQALMSLLDAVDEDAEVHDQALATMIDGGMAPTEARPPVNGYIASTRAGGESFPFFPKAEHLIAVLQAVQYSRHRNSFTGINGRELGKFMPGPIDGGPRISPDVAAESG